MTQRETALFFEHEAVKIIHDDILTTESILENSIDLIVTSPPYNLAIPYRSYHDALSYAQETSGVPETYLDFSEQWLRRCYHLLKDDGRLCLNIPLDKNKGGQQSVGADLTTVAKKVGYQYHATIIWNEGNISRRTAWGSWMRASAPYVIAPVELIVVFYKRHWKKISGSGDSDITRDEFLEWTNGLWTFPGESKKKIGHPAPFPLELPRRCIKLFSFVGDTILDPFMGSGTTLIAAALNARRGIGVEIDQEYCELARERLATEGRIYESKFWNGQMPKSIQELVMEFFARHPYQEFQHGIVVDWVTEQWLREHSTPPRDPWRAIRKLHQQGQLIKVKKGIYKYDPDIVRSVELWDFPSDVREKILKRDGYRCVVCGRGRNDGVELVVDHITPKDKGGSNAIDNGQTLCSEHNLLKKNYSQTEAGKRYFIKIYERAVVDNNERMISFCKAVFDVYDNFGIDSHLGRPDAPETQLKGFDF